MQPRPCPRCGKPVPSSDGKRGRPRRWCSDECRRLSSDGRRAARADGRVVEVHEQIRERVVVRNRPLTLDGAVDRVLADEEATRKLLRVLAYRMRHDPPIDRTHGHDPTKFLIYDLWQAYHQAGGSNPPVAMPEILPAEEYLAPGTRAEAHQQAVSLVLGSPRSVREVLTTLTEWARNGTLARGEHSGTLRAAHGLLDALHTHRLLRQQWR